MKKLEYPVAVLAVIALLVVLLISAVEIAAYGDYGFFQREYEKYQVLEDVDMEMDDLMHVTKEMMAYLRGDRPELSVETTVGGQKMDFFNEQDRIHMKDVQILFIRAIGLRRLCAAIFAVATALLIALKAKVKKILPKAFFGVLAAIAIVICFIVICAVIDFNRCFTVFHEIFFDNDLWLFDPETDLMINVLVEGFFMDIAVRIVWIFGALLAVPALSGLFLLVREKHGKRVKTDAAKVMSFLLAGLLAAEFVAAPSVAWAAPDKLESPVKEIVTDHVDHDFSFPEQWPEAPELIAEAAVLMEVTTGTVLYAKNADVELYPASMTKVMTGLLVSELGTMSDVVTYSRDAVINHMEPDAMHMGILVGEKLTVQESMYGMMLLSANDAANGLAEYIAGTNENFAVLMNRKAKELGALNTHFANPSGLFDEDHYTTCYDMALILAAAVQNPTYMSISTTYKYTIEQTEDYKRTCYAYLSHKMKPGSAYEYEGFVCGKTGWVEQSGNTLATYCERDGMKLIAVVMKDGNPGHYEDTVELMDYGFDQFKLNQIDGSLISSETGTDHYLGGSDLFEQSGFTIEENHDSYIVLPKDAQLSDVVCTLNYELEDGEMRDGLIANIIYSYYDMVVGSGTLEFVKNDTDFSDPNIGERPTEGSTEEEQPKQEIILTVGQVILYIVLFLIFVLMIIILVIYFQPKRVTARRIQRRRRARAKRYRMRRGWDKR